MSTQIKTLAQLQEEKKKLKMQIEVSKRAFIHSFGVTQSQAKDFLVKKVVIPAGTVGLATVGVNQFRSSPSSHKNTATNKSFFTKVLPIILPLVQSFLADPKLLQTLPPFVQQIVTSQVVGKKARNMESA